MTSGAGEPERQALQVADDLVQALALAKYALATGDANRAAAAIDQALELAKTALSGRLGVATPDDPATPGGLVRSRPPTSPAD